MRRISKSILPYPMSVDSLIVSLSDLDLENEESVVTVKYGLHHVATALATSTEERISVGAKDGLWGGLYQLWRILTQRCLDSPHPAQHDLDVLLLTARFTRNLVAGVPKNQAVAFQVEPQIRSLIHYFTSFLMLQLPTLVSTTHLLLQTLSNIVTHNEELSSSLWKTYMGIPDDGNILIRILAVDDVKTLTTCFILMLNVTRNSPEGCRLFVESKAGQRIAIKILNRIVILIDATEGTPEATACDMAYQFLRPIFDLGFGVTLYDFFSLDGEPMLPHQRILLKLMDGYFQTPTAIIHTDYTQSIPRLYSNLVTETLSSIKYSLGAEPIAPEPHLPALSEGVVLAAQCSQALLLRESDLSLNERLTLNAMILEGADKVGSIALTVDTLRSLDLLLPRIQFGKTVPSLMAKGHVDSEDLIDPTAFPYVKRDLLRLLGTLSHQNRLVQDRMRECGGIEIVMSHCVVDELNPYLREHAIFALRNLLQDNVENQQAVKDLKPLRGFDDAGVLRNLDPST